MKGKGHTLSVVSYIRPVIKSQLNTSAGKVVKVIGVDNGQMNAAITGSVGGEVEGR